MGSIDENSLTELTIYPNPANEILTISFEGNEAEYLIELTDHSGRLITQQSINNVSILKSTTLNLANVKDGSYVVVISSANGNYSEKVVIN